MKRGHWIALLCGAALAACSSHAAQHKPAGARGDASVASKGRATRMAADDEDAGATGARDGAAAAEAMQPLCSVDGFCWELPTPQGETLRAVWASAPDDVWAVGDGGVVIHYDGKVFREEHVGVREDLLAVHGSGPNDVWAVGKGTNVLHYDGTAWNSQDAADMIAASGAAKNAALYGVFALASDSVFLVGYSGVSGLILHFDGHAFSSQALALKLALPLRAVWALSATEAWAVGDGGAIASFDGTQWNADKSPTAAALYSVHALAAYDVWAVGEKGNAVHWDGKRWTTSNTGVAGTLACVRVDIAAPPPSDAGMTMPMPKPMPDAGADAGLPKAPTGPWSVWAFGDKGQVLRYNGALWAELPSDTTLDFYGAARLHDGVMLGVGESGQITRFDADARQSLSQGSRRNHLALWGSGSTLWSVGDEIARRDATKGWSTLENPGGRSLYGVWGDASQVWAVGTAGSIVRFKDSAWQSVAASAAGETWLHSVAGAGSSVWIVGDGGLALVSAAGSFLKIATPVKTNLIDVWGSADDQFWAVGDAGTVLRWDGMAWLKVPTGPMGGVAQNLRAVWGSAEDDVWIVGTEGTILHWTGARFETQSQPAGYSLNDVWGRSKDDVYAVGSGGVALHFDGNSWSQLETGTQASLQAVFGDDAKVFAAGLGGVVLRLER